MTDYSRRHARRGYASSTDVRIAAHVASPVSSAPWLAPRIHGVHVHPGAIARVVGGRSFSSVLATSQICCR